MVFTILHISEHAQRCTGVDLAARSGLSVRFAESLEEAGRNLEPKPDLAIVRSGPEESPAFCRAARDLAVAAGIPVLHLPQCPDSAEIHSGQVGCAVFESIPAMVAVFEPALRLRIVNREFARKLGWQPEDAARCDLLPLLFPEPEELRRFRQLLEEARADWTPFRVTARDRRVLYTRWAAARAANGWLVAAGQGCVASGPCEEASRAREERLGLMLKHGSEIIVMRNSRGAGLFVSDSVTRVLGYDPETYLRFGMTGILHPDDVHRRMRSFEEARRSPGAMATVDIRVRHADGSWRYLSVIDTNCLDVPGINAMISTGRDITKRKEVEARLVASQDRLRNLAARIEAIREEERTLIAREVHDELGQMLTALKMEAEGLEVRLRQIEGATPELAARARTIIGHIESGMDSVRRIAAELRPGVLDYLGLSAAIEWQAGEFKARTGILCRISLPAADPPLARQASTAVFRVFQEILTNAARHSGATAIRIRMTLRSDALVLDVRDNGCGIEEGKITDPNSLGLLGMRERALSLGGSIDFRRSARRGTIVRLRVPLLAAKPASRPRTGARDAAASAPSSKPLRILLADDHALVRQGLREILLRTFPLVSLGEAGDGQQAIDMLSSSDWDLLILDISMPRKSGLEVLGELKDEGSTVPVLVLSMHDEADFGRHVRDAGGAGFLPKARAAGGLAEAIRTVLAGDTYFEQSAATR